MPPILVGLSQHKSVLLAPSGLRLSGLSASGCKYLKQTKEVTAMRAHAFSKIDPERPGRHRLRKMTAVLVAVIATLIVGAFVARIMGSPLSTEEIAEAAHVRLPRGTRILHLHYVPDGRPGEMLAAVLSIPPDGVAQLRDTMWPYGVVVSPNEKPPEFASKGGIPYVPETNWWKPGLVRKFVAMDNGGRTSVMVDLDDPAHPILYLYYTPPYDCQ